MNGRRVILLWHRNILFKFVVFAYVGSASFRLAATSFLSSSISWRACSCTFMPLKKKIGKYWFFLFFIHARPALGSRDHTQKVRERETWKIRDQSRFVKGFFFFPRETRCLLIVAAAWTFRLDEPFHNFKALKSVARRFWTIQNWTIHGFGGSKIVTELVGGLLRA